MTIEWKWQVILTVNGYNDFNMWAPPGCKIAKKTNNCLDEINLVMILCHHDEFIYLYIMYALCHVILHISNLVCCCK